MKPLQQCFAMKSLNYQIARILHHKHLQPPSFYSIIIVILMALCISTHSQDFAISVSHRNSNQLADYTVRTAVQQNFSVPANALLALSLPQQYNTAALRTRSYTGGAATDSCLQNCALLTVSLSGNSLIINGLFPYTITAGTKWSFRYTIFNVLNPNVQNPSNFTITIFLGSTIYYQRSGISFITSPTFLLQTVTFTTAVLNPTIWAVSPVTFTITPNFVIDTIRITFPPNWALQTKSTAGTMANSPTCISTTNPTALCSYLALAFTVTNLLYYSSGVPIDVTVYSINNPSSMANAGGISIVLQANGSTVQQTTGYSIPGSSFQNDILRNPSALLTYLSNDRIQIQLNFQFAQWADSTDVIYLTIPSELTLLQNDSSYTILVAGSVITPTITYFGANNTMRFNVSVTDKLMPVNLTITGMTRPHQCRNLSNFLIRTLRAGLYMMDSTTCCSLQLANRQTLSINSIGLSSDLQRQTSVTYTFTFTTSAISAANIITTDYIQIVFPPEYSSTITAANSTTLCGTLTLLLSNNPALKKTPTCTITLNQLTISSFLTGNLPGSETFVVGLGGVTNPSSPPTTGFAISTVSSSNYVIEQSLNYPVTINPNVISPFLVTATPLTTCTNAVYTFTLGNNSPLSNGYSIQVDFPSDFTLADFNAMQCKINSVIFPCARKNSTFNTPTISVIITVNSVLASISPLAISAISNPISKAQTGSFSVSILDASGTVAEITNYLQTVTMNSVATFSYFFATAANYSSASAYLQNSIQLFNSVTNSVWLTMTVPFSPFVTPASLLIVFATSSKISFSSGISTCLSPQITNTCSITNNAVTGNMEVSFANILFASPNSNFIQIEVTDLFISDYKNLQITASMDINGFASLSLSPSVKIGKVYAEPISNYALSLSSQILGQTNVIATLTISCSAQTSSQLTSIIVYMPQQFGAGSYTVTILKANFIANQLTINGLTNPTVQTYTPFLFTILNSNGDVIAFSTPTDPTKIYAFTLACSLPCRKCISPGVCSDCYNTISWIPQIYFRSSADTCVTRCIEGEYLSSGSCLACSGTCLTCLIYGNSFTNGNGTYCLSCPGANVLSGSTCLAVCPTGFYPSLSICTPCMTNCLTCTSANTCSTCQPGLFLTVNQCLSACPSATVSYTNPVTFQASCIACPSNCISCSSAPSPSCLNCNNGYYLNSGSCIADCSTVSLYISYLNACAACQCKTCSTYAYVCLSCNSPNNLYKNQCIANCPSGYYPSSNVCQICASNCLSCTSASNCNYCLIPYALYTNAGILSCTLTCPAGTINTIDSSTFKYVCQSCSEFCLNCQTSVTFCLSCITGYILNNNTCTSTCPTGYHNISSSCLKCSPACQSCTASNPYNCSVCASNNFYFNFTCSTSCSTGTYPDISSLICKACHPVCSACLNSTNCTTCASGYFLHNFFCYNDCKLINSFYYSYKGACLVCQPQCTTCLTTPFQCSSCSFSAYYFNPIDKSCSFSCAVPYYINGSICSPCQSPCYTCDTLFDSCSSCNGSLNLMNGKCISSCPSGYFTSANVCLQCPSSCLTCNVSVCITCQYYAYRYLTTCVSDCQSTSLPITIDTYCTSCAEVPYCQSCQTSASSTFVCFACIYPYVIFQGHCLNSCPDLYAVDASNNCLPTPQYSAYLSQLYSDNYPYFPPFTFFGLLVVISGIIAYRSYKIYIYSYHFGYLIALSAVFELIFLGYGCKYIVNLYQGDYSRQNKSMPLFVLGGSFAVKLLLNVLYVIIVIGLNYLKDVRFIEWKDRYQNNFKLSVGLTIVFGCRFYKLYYSKLLGKGIFSYRIISVQKFYYQDLFVWVSMLLDIVDVSAFAIINYNIFVTYAVLYLFSFELLLFKGAQWVMLAYDFKKPDRGFFFGDEQQAEKMIQEENELKQKEKKKFEMESLVKLIRRKSAENLRIEKLYQHLFIDDFRSVYNPKDYEDVPVVPNKKIQKNINRGTFRKGKRITIQQKLKRFAQSIKPSPIVSKNDALLNGLIYWKPPKQLKVQKKEPDSQESMLNLLQDKELYYENVTNVEIIDLQDNHIAHDEPSRIKRRKRTGFGIDQQTVVNQTYDQIYDPSSIEFIEEEDNDLNGFWNRNYAKRQHLPKAKIQSKFDENDLRVFYHQPLKKRRSKLNQIKARHY